MSKYRNGNPAGQGGTPPGANGQSFPIDPQSYVDSSKWATMRFGRFNLAIIGGTGVGKSSLVNAVFGRDVAKVGRGMPVTSGLHYYHDDGLGIWDFEGFEIGSQRAPGQALREHLSTIAGRPHNEQIAVVWYCVLSTSDRLTQPDIEMIRELHAAGLPVILVLTKVDWVKNPVTGMYKLPENVAKFQAWLERPVDHAGQPIYLPIARVIPTSTISPRGLVPKRGRDTGHGLGDLITATLELSPQSARDAFRIAQQINLPWKRDLARPVIAQAAGAAAAAAAVPIPVADAVVLAPIQMAMMARVAGIYDLELKTMMSSSALAQIGAQMSGRALARSLLKLIPGVGSVVNASVAMAITAATGEGWRLLCENVYSGNVSVNQLDSAWQKYVPTAVEIFRQWAATKATRRA